MPNPAQDLTVGRQCLQDHKKLTKSTWYGEKKLSVSGNKAKLAESASLGKAVIDAFLSAKLPPTPAATASTATSVLGKTLGARPHRQAPALGGFCEQPLGPRSYFI